ncbi:MAG: substrate-binding domain-containing protein [Pirellulales bacterium]|nr:substrate-binding domain-containing protein [Pirellulales bacterium]
MQQAKRIALLIDTATSWGRGIIRGIRQFNDTHENWSLYLQPWGNFDRFCLPRPWHGDGVIARVSSAQIAEELLEFGGPVVNVSWTNFGAGQFARCIPNPRTVARLAIEHFRELGLANFAYAGCTVFRPGQADDLGQCYAHELLKLGYDCSSHQSKQRYKTRQAWEEQLEHLVQWLKSLPKPAGVLCWDAICAHQVTEACHIAGLALPEELAILAGDYDEVMCGTAKPPLSSVDLPGEQVGYQAANLLKELIEGAAVPPEPLLVDPISVTVRHSTDSVAIDDPLLSQAIRFIREHAIKGITVKDILRHVPLCRRALEQGLMKYLRRSPAEEIRRIRLQHAQNLLLYSRLSMPEVAKACGFANSDHLLRNFRRALGISPTLYRRKHLKSIKK